MVPWAVVLRMVEYGSFYFAGWGCGNLVANSELASKW